MNPLRARRHWVALDDVFARTLRAEDLARARQAFSDHVDAVSDVCLQLLCTDAPPELRAAASALKSALHDRHDRTD